MNDLKTELQMFTGTEKYHKLTPLPLLATDGVAYLTQKAGCFWLIDAIASYQAKIVDEGFQIWILKKTGSKAVLTCREDYSEKEPDKYKPIITQHIDYTDFPLDEIKIYVIDNVALLPSEY